MIRKLAALRLPTGKALGIGPLSNSGLAG